tara:strand:+ start:794 stop:1117 length:324 start_codon:yes stop_codon:yes gene_type:complete
MTKRQREDIVQKILSKQTAILTQIKDRIEKCSCTDNCGWHIFGKLEMQLSDVLLQELEDYFLKEQDVKLYTSDLGLMMDGIEKFAEDKVEEKIYKADVQPRKSKGWK